MNTGGAHKKERSKLEKILRQDHSDVYFDNERLNDDLNRRINSMEKQMHISDIQRGIEIGKLRREIGETRAIRTKSAQQQLEELSAQRPHTAAGNYRKPKVKTKQRAQSAWERTDSKRGSIDDIEYVADPLNDNNNLERTNRSESLYSEASTLRNPKTLKRYKVIDPSCFKENNKFPEEWYKVCLPASDAAIYNAHKKVRGKSAPSKFGLLGQLRAREKSDRNMMSFSKHKISTTQDNMTDASGLERMSLVCEEPVKPVLMSRRRLKELSNVDNMADRGPSRNTLRKQDMITKNGFEVRQIGDKVKEFCKDLEDLRVKEELESKEREEARKREAQEKMYLKNIDLNQIQAVDDKANEDEDSDDENFRKKWRKV